jgi:hypothetical protein
MATRLETYFFVCEASRKGVSSLSQATFIGPRGQRVLQAPRFLSWIEGEDA